MDAWAPGREVYETARRNSAAGRGKRGHLLPAAHAVQRLCGTLPAVTIEQLLAIFRDDVEEARGSLESVGTMADLYGAKTDPINIRIQEVKNGRVYYLIRGNDKGRPITIRRLKDLLRKFNAANP